MAKKKVGIELDPTINPNAARTIAEKLAQITSVANKNNIFSSAQKANNSYQQHSGNYMSGTAGANLQAQTDQMLRLIDKGHQLKRELKELQQNHGDPSQIKAKRQELGYGTDYNFDKITRRLRNHGAYRQESRDSVGIGSNFKPIYDNFTELHKEGRTSRPAGIKGSIDQQNEHTSALRGIADDFGGFKRKANSIGGQINRNRNTLTSAESRGKISYEAYTALKGRMSDQQSQVQSTLGDFGKKSQDISSQIGSRKDSISAINNNDKLDSETKLKRTSEINDEIKALQKQKDELDSATKSLTKFAATLDNQQHSLDKSVENRDVRVGHSKDSVLGMLASRKTSLLLGASGNAINGVKNGIAGGNQLRQQMEGNINGVVLGNAINGGSVVNAGDNHLQDTLSRNGVPFGKSVTTMAQYANALSSTGNTSATKAASGANQMAGFSRYNNVSDETTTGIFQTLGQSGALGGNPSNTISTLSKQFSGMLANNRLGGRAQEQAEGLQSIYSTAQAQGGTMSTNEAKQLMAMQSVLSKGSGGKSMVGQQGAQNIAGVANMFASNGFNDPFLRAGFAGNNAQYSGQQGLYHLQSDMMNPLAHPQSMSNGIRAMAQGRGGYWGAVEKLQESGVDQKGAQQIVKQSLNGNISNANLKKIQEAEESKGKSTQKNSKAQFKANGNSTLDISVSIDDEGKMHTSESMDKGRAMSNGAKGLVNQTGVGAMAGSMVGSVAGGASSMIGMMGADLLGKGAGKLLGKTKLGSKLFNSKLGSFMDLDGFTSAGSTAEKTASGLTKSSRIVRGVNLGKGTAEAASGASKVGLLSRAGSTLGKSVGVLGKAKPLLRVGGKILGKAAGPLAIAGTAVDAFGQLKGANKRNRGSKIGKATGVMAGGLGGMYAGGATGAAIGTAVLPGVGTAIGAGVGSIAGSLAGTDIGKSVGGFFGSMFDPKKKKKSTDNHTTASKKQKHYLYTIQKDLHSIKNLVAAFNKVALQGTAGSNGQNKNDNSYDNKSDADIAHMEQSAVDNNALSNGGGSNQTINQSLKFDFRGSSAPASELSNVQSRVQHLVRNASNGRNANNDFWSTSKTLS